MRAIESVLVTVRGVVPLTRFSAPESRCYVMYMCANRACYMLSIHMIKYVLVRELAYYNKKTVSNIRPQMSFD